jgi:hypothetical protein
MLPRPEDRVWPLLGAAAILLLQYRRQNQCFGHRVSSMSRGMLLVDIMNSQAAACKEHMKKTTPTLQVMASTTC